MVFTTLAFLLMLTTPADAGKLADGWKGVPYGPDTVLQTAPLPGCTPNSEEGVRWMCDDTIGGAVVRVAYFSDESLFTGVGVFCEGYTVCTTLRGVFTAAWGLGSPQHDFDKGAMADWYWHDSTVRAAWSYNQFSDKGHVITWDTVLHDRIKALQAERAKNAAGAL